MGKSQQVREISTGGPALSLIRNIIKELGNHLNYHFLQVANGCKCKKVRTFRLCQLTCALHAGSSFVGLYDPY